MPEPVLVSEKQFAATVRAYAEAKGWLCWTTWRSIHSPAGEPDLRLIREKKDGTAEMVVAELKSERGKLTSAQTQSINLLQKVPGIRVFVWRPSDWDTIEKVLE